MRVAFVHARTGTISRDRVLARAPKLRVAARAFW